MGSHSGGRATDPAGRGITMSIGQFIGPEGTTNLQEINRAWFAWAIGGATITKIGLRVVTQSGNFDVGIYGTTSNAPGTRKGSAGATAVPAAGYVEIALTASTVVTAQDWFAVAADNTTAAFPYTGVGSSLNTTGAPTPVCYKTTSYPLPASITSPTFTYDTVTYCPMLGVA